MTHHELFIHLRISCALEALDVQCIRMAEILHHGELLHIFPQ